MQTDIQVQAPSRLGHKEFAGDASNLQGLALIVRSEVRQALRRRGDLAEPLAFFILVSSLFPLAIGAQADGLVRIGAGVVWVCALLSVLLSLPRLFARDYANATLEQWLLAPQALPALVAGKMIGHWLLTGLPLTLLAPILGMAFGLDTRAAFLLGFTVLLGTPSLTMIGAVGAALALGARGSSILIAILVLPLYIPVLIFGAGAVDAMRSGIDESAWLLMLGAGALACAVLAPLAAAAGLRISIG